MFWLQRPNTNKRFIEFKTFQEVKKFKDSMKSRCEIQGNLQHIFFMGCGNGQYDQMWMKIFGDSTFFVLTERTDTNNEAGSFCFFDGPHPLLGLEGANGGK